MSPPDSSPHELTAHDFRRVMGYFATGVTIVTAHDGVETRGMTANAFMSGSLDPLLCVVSVARRANMHSHLERAGAFGVSILSSEQQPLASHFGGRPVANLVVDFAPVGGIPTLPGAVAWLTAETVATYPCGDHTLFVARVMAMQAGDGVPLLFHRGRYAALVSERQESPAPDLQ